MWLRSFEFCVTTRLPTVMLPFGIRLRLPAQWRVAFSCTMHAHGEGTPSRLFTGSDAVTEPVAVILGFFLTRSLAKP